MRTLIVWHNNGIENLKVEDYGYTEHVTASTVEAIREEYVSAGIKVYRIDEYSM